MGKKLRVLLIEPMKKPRIVTINDSLESMQEAVGGYIEAVYPWDDSVALVCNDEGKISRMAPNRMLEDYDFICGSFFICGVSGDDFVSLSDELAEKYRKKFLYPEVFMRTDDGQIVSVKIQIGNVDRTE